MYRRIFFNKNIPLKRRIKNSILYYALRRGIEIDWSKRFEKIFSRYPEYKNRVETEVEDEHKEYWKIFSGRINLNTLRVCKNISGIANPKYVPEDIFIADIEPTLNTTKSVEYFTYKSFYSRWFPNASFPECFFHNVDGEWLDNDLNPISFPDIERIVKKLKYPVVFKPNRDSYGGMGIYFPEDANTLLDLVKKSRNFLVQERIIQHPFFNKFNNAGLNTIRVCLYRSVKDNKIKLLNCALRMGIGGSLDNETAGGIVCYIDQNGLMCGTARDKNGKNYYFHPDTKLTFSEKIPAFSALLESSNKISSNIFYSRLTSLDFCLDINEVWRPIEVNIFGQTIRFSQYAGTPFFGEFSDEVIEYCIRNHWALKR